jgi:hypothetical protein
MTTSRLLKPALFLCQASSLLRPTQDEKNPASMMTTRAWFYLQHDTALRALKKKKRKEKKNPPPILEMRSCKLFASSTLNLPPSDLNFQVARITGVSHQHLAWNIVNLAYLTELRTKNWVFIFFFFGGGALGFELTLARQALLQLEPFHQS